MNLILACPSALSLPAQSLGNVGTPAANDETHILKSPSFVYANSPDHAIALDARGVADDCNCLFHPLGDHTQVRYFIDGHRIREHQTTGSRLERMRRGRSQRRI